MHFTQAVVGLCLLWHHYMPSYSSPGPVTGQLEYFGLQIGQLVCILPRLWWVYAYFGIIICLHTLVQDLLLDNLSTLAFK
jgi:hypothetical protein